MDDENREYSLTLFPVLIDRILVEKVLDSALKITTERVCINKRMSAIVLAKISAKLLILLTELSLLSGLDPLNQDSVDKKIC